MSTDETKRTSGDRLLTMVLKRLDDSAKAAEKFSKLELDAQRNTLGIEQLTKDLKELKDAVHSVAKNSTVQSVAKNSTALWQVLTPVGMSIAAFIAAIAAYIEKAT